MCCCLDPYQTYHIYHTCRRCTLGIPNSSLILFQLYSYNIYIYIFVCKFINTYIKHANDKYTETSFARIRLLDSVHLLLVPVVEVASDRLGTSSALEDNNSTDNNYNNDNDNTDYNDYNDDNTF